MSDAQSRSTLDKTLPMPGWYGISAIAILLVAAFVRLFRLDGYLLNSREASWAYDAFSLFNGRPLPIGQELPESGPFMIVWNAISFFLFGVSDATARVGSVILGLGLIASIYLLRPILTRAQILGITGILAVSPTMVFASRTIEPGIATAFFAVLVLVSLVRIGHTSVDNNGWAILLGVSIAALYATGPLGVSTLLALGIAVVFIALLDLKTASDGAIGSGFQRVGRSPSPLFWMLGSLIVSLLVMFTRVLSAPEAVVGLSTTMVDWANMMSSGPSTIPAVFYFWSLMLYETIAVVIAFATAFLARRNRLNQDKTDRSISPLFFVIWFAGALLLHTLASTRDTSSAVLVALPVLLLAGMGLGQFIETSIAAHSPRAIAAVLVGTLLVVYSVNATVGLAFTRGESGTEPLAHDTPSADTRSFIDQVMRLSRDISVENPNAADPTGHYGLTIQVTPQYEWPFTWYFRDFADFSVTPAASFSEDTDVAIAPNNEVMESVGLTSFELNWIVRPGDPLTMMDTTEILRTGLRPSNWGDAWRYMIHRDTEKYESNRHLTVGYGHRLMDKLTTTEEPVNLFDENLPGAQIGPGQVNHPGAIAIGPDGKIYVASAMNNRIEIFDATGNFVDAWSPATDPRFRLGWNNSQGASSMTFGPDGRLYIADTWNHLVLVVSDEGVIELEIGERGRQADITDEGDPSTSTGLFFGPRGVAVTADRIYVTDTGNERVQMFGLDGAYIGVFGGFGETDGRFVEPTGIAVDSTGIVWVADSGNARLQSFDAEGNWLASHSVSLWENQFGIQRFNMIAFNSDDVLFFTTPEFGVWAWTEGSAAVAMDPEVAEVFPTLDLIDGFGDLRAGDIAISADDRILVTRIEENRVDEMEVVPPDSLVSTPATPAATPTN